MTAKVCQVSGGVDSAAALIQTLRFVRPGDEIVAHFIDYGQPYREQERRAARAITARLAVKLIETTVNLRLDHDGGKPAAYFPIRNLVLAALSANLAAALAGEDSCVVVGSKTTVMRSDDPYCFADCTESFYRAMAAASAEAGGPREILRPLAGWTKRDALDCTAEVGIPLIDMWWCYEAGDASCGLCKHCTDVAAALALKKAPE